MTIKRRQLIGGAAAALAAASWPNWLKRAFSDETAGADNAGDLEETTPAAKTLARAYERAENEGKPLLVFVIPEKDEEKWDRGCAFGELLNHGTPEQVAPLALAEVVCATMADLAKLVPAAAGSGEPLMVLIDTQKAPADVQKLDAKLTPYESWMARGDDDPEPRPEDDISAERVQALAGLIAGFLVPSDAVIAARAECVRARLAPADAAQVEWALSDRGRVPEPLVDRSAAIILQAAKQGRISSTTAITLLAGAVARRLVTVPPDGAHWANSGGCGADVEETPEEKAAREEREQRGESDPGVGVLCGMGYVPEKARRMLYFYTVDRAGLQ